MALWPAVSGNSINGLGEADPRRPSPHCWHPPDSIPHGPLQRWFQQHNAGGPLITQARAERQAALDAPLGPLASDVSKFSPAQWTAGAREAALAGGADIVGVTRMRTDWVFEGHAVAERYIVMIGVAHDWERMKTAPEEPSFAEVVTQYARGNRAAKAAASWLRAHGHDAEQRMEVRWPAPWPWCRPHSPAASANSASMARSSIVNWGRAFGWPRY
jgi:hypothetical protein